MCVCDKEWVKILDCLFSFGPIYVSIYVLHGVLTRILLLILILMYMTTANPSPCLSQSNIMTPFAAISI